MTKEKNIIVRVGELFNNQIEEVKKERIANRTDKKKKSTKTLTNLITKHKDWETIKKDLINFKIGGKDE